MRIWHEKLITRLCSKHLVAVWREGLGAFKILTENKKGYRNHPAVIEFEDSTGTLYERLILIREEAKNRGYNFKSLPLPTMEFTYGKVKEWQTLEEQVEVLKSKNCKCDLKGLIN